MNSIRVRPNVPDCEGLTIPFTYHTFIDARARDAEVVFVDAKHVIFIAQNPPKAKGCNIDLFV